MNIIRHPSAALGGDSVVKTGEHSHYHQAGANEKTKNILLPLVLKAELESSSNVVLYSNSLGPYIVFFFPFYK